MKENRLYTLLQSHRKTGMAIFWIVAVFFGCFCFPFIKTSTTNTFEEYKRFSMRLLFKKQSMMIYALAAAL